MSEQLNTEHQTPWNMPQDIFWNHGKHAELKRLQWIVENRPDLSDDEIDKIMPFRPDVVAAAALANNDSQTAKDLKEIVQLAIDAPIQPTTKLSESEIGALVLSHLPLTDIA